VQHYLEVAGLWDDVKDRLHDPATRLSIGQQQRVCLARGLAVEPEILLGDEPTSALDPISAAKIEARLLELKEKYTIVVVTHTLRQAKRLADYVVFMYLGEVVEAGSARQVFESTRSRNAPAATWAACFNKKLNTLFPGCSSSPGSFFAPVFLPLDRVFFR
jgi:phosphate transport system ATP-binding protein